jgi:hypothetical protein
MVDREVIGCPMAGKSGYGATPLRADARRRRHHIRGRARASFAVDRNSIQATRNRRRARAAAAPWPVTPRGGVEARPVLEELVTTMLGHEETACRFKGETLAIANATRVALGRRKGLVGLVGIVAPDACTGLLFRARIETP